MNDAMTDFTAHRVFPLTTEPPPFASQSSDGSSECPASPTSMPRTPTLTPRTIEPEYLNKSAEAASRVGRIQWLDVVPRHRERGEQQSYDVLVFLHQNAGHIHMPTRSSRPTDRHPTLTPPDHRTSELTVRVSRDVGAFKRLRDELLTASLEPHDRYCRACDALQPMLTFGAVRPAMALWVLLPSTTRVNVLTHFVRAVVSQYLGRAAPNPGRHICPGERQLLLMLDVFLFDGTLHRPD